MCEVTILGWPYEFYKAMLYFVKHHASLSRATIAAIVSLLPICSLIRCKLLPRTLANWALCTGHFLMSISRQFLSTYYYISFTPGSPGTPMAIPYH